MHLNPAEYVVHIFGGVRKTAHDIGRSPSSVSKWNKPIVAKGCGGEIPRLSQRAVLHVAKVKGFDITPNDLNYGRDISGVVKIITHTRIIEKNAIPSKKGKLNPIKHIRSAPQMKEGSVSSLEKHVMDTEWFHDKIKSRYESLRKFSKMMQGRHGQEFDVAALSLMLRGKRAMQLDEARQIAKLLDVSFMTVVTRAIGPVE